MRLVKVAKCLRVCSEWTSKQTLVNGGISDDFLKIANCLHCF